MSTQSITIAVGIFFLFTTNGGKITLLYVHGVIIFSKEIVDYIVFNSASLCHLKL